MSSVRKEKIKLNKVKNINYTEFDKRNINCYYMATYFAYKYDNVHILDYSINYFKKEDLDKKVVHDIYIKNLNDSIPDTGNERAECITNFDKCKQDSHIRFIVIMFFIKHIIEDRNHANCIIYDKNDNSFELFEPHGSTVGDLDIDTRYEYIKNYLYELFGFYNYFYLPIDYCPYTSFQRSALENKLKYFNTYGFCLAWNLWYIDTKLSNVNINSNIDRDTLVELLLKSIDSDYFNDFIGNYSAFIIYISNVVKGCAGNICNMENILFTLILQFFDLIDIDIIVFGHCSSNAKVYLKKIINNCGKPHLIRLCWAINCNHDHINSNNYSLRKALRTIVKKYDDMTCCKLYTDFISTFYDNKYNIFSYNDPSKLCPYDISILQKIRDNMIDAEYQPSQPDKLSRRDAKCNNIYRIMVKGTVKDIVRQYGLLLLLLDYDKFNIYKKTHGFESYTYFSSINHLVYKFKDLPVIKDEVTTITNNIMLNAKIYYKEFNKKNYQEIDPDKMIDPDILIEELYKEVVNPSEQLKKSYKNMLKYKKVKNELNKVKDTNYIKIDKINIHNIIAYFTYKYDNICFLDYSVNCKNNIIGGINKYNITFSNLNATPLDIGDSEEKFRYSFSKCLNNLKNKFIIILVYNQITNFETILNFAMYDRKMGVFEIFRPYEDTSNGAFNISLEEKLSDYAPNPIYKYTNYYSNHFFQKLVKKNKLISFEFNLSWTLWYLDTKLKHIQIDNEELIHRLHREINIKQFVSLIDNYSSFIACVSDAVQYCKTYACDIDNILFSFIIQFFDLIDIDIIVFEHCNSNAKIYLIRIINNCGKSHLVRLCEMINYSPVHSANYMLRKELRKNIKNYDDATCCTIYVNFISLFCDNTNNIFSYHDTRKLCPYDTSILKKIRDNMIDSDPQQSRSDSAEFECNDIYRIINTGIIKDINKQYGLLLLLLDKGKFDSYKKAHGFESYNYFSAIKNLVNKFKDSPTINNKISEIVLNITLNVTRYYTSKNIST